MTALRTSDIGRQPDGSILMYAPPISQTQLVTPGVPPTLAIGPPTTVAADAVIAAGAWVFEPTGNADIQIIHSDGTATAPANGKIFPLTV